DLAEPARRGLPHAEQAHHVDAVGVEAQRATRPGLVPRSRRGAGRGGIELPHAAVDAELVAHLSNQLALGVLVAGRAQVSAEAPVEPAELLLRVALDRQASQQDDTSPVLEGVADLSQVAAETGKREVLAGDVAPGQTAARHALQGGVDLVARRSR